MKNSNYNILVIFLLFTTVCFSQGFQGKVVYQTKTTVDMKLDSTRFNPEQQKRIADRMKSMNEKVYVLSFNASESIYKEEEKLEQPGQGGRFRFGGFTNGKKFKVEIKNVYY